MLYNPISALTPRQLDVIRLSRAGFSRQEIALELQIAPATLDWHFSRIRRHLPTFRTRPRPIGLTKREREIAVLIAEGRDNRAISQLLGISIGTLRNHISQIYLKTHAENRVMLALTTLIAENRLRIGDTISGGQFRDASY